MKITKAITINKSVEQVWDLIAHQFDKAHLWMGPIPHSRALGPGNSLVGAPMQGRICDLDSNPKGAKVKETITHYSERDKTLAFEVLPINNPAIIPIKQNKVRMTVRAIGKTKTEVVWIASPELKPLARFFNPLLKPLFSIAFSKLLQGLKDYIENEMPPQNAVKA